MDFFSVPRLSGWAFQHPSTSHLKKPIIFRLIGAMQRSQSIISGLPSPLISISTNCL
ncbi:MAG: hypothetical protein ACQEQO_06335 [Thermodesulfobacteriota bacterium]